MRGTTDYWVNDALGRPFFVVSHAVTYGLAATLLDKIVPELVASVPGQPSEAELAADPLLHRFVVIFDREGSSHSLLSKLWEQRIGAITYRKAVKDLWLESEFSEVEVPVPGDGVTRMQLATRQTALTAGKASTPILEIRRLTQTGHQTAIITTAQRHAELGAQTLRNDGSDIEQRAERLHDIQRLETDAAELRLKRRQTPRKVTIASLPENERPRQLRPLGKILTDTVKMIAYRAETALVGLLRPHLAKEEEARALIRELFVSSADLEPNERENTLTVHIHRMACPAHDKAIAALFADLTRTDFRHPETGMRLIYELA